MKNLSKKTQARLKIVGATVTAVFSLASAFSATYAWFASNQTVQATGMLVSVKAEEGIQFNLYYLDYFAVNQSTDKDKDGNYDSVNESYAGYEIPTNNPVFKLVDYNTDGTVKIDETTHNKDPMNISNLWPAHKLTYAIVVTGNLTSFNLDSWGEVKNPNVLAQVNNQTVQVSLSWAIDIFGGAYYVSQTNSITDDIKTGFASYSSDLNSGTVIDKFTYDQTSTISYDTSLNIVNSISGTSGNNKRVILYFSVEFSDDPSTFYFYNKTTTYYEKYVSGDTTGFNSNCYEGLSLTNLSFRLF